MKSRIIALSSATLLLAIGLTCGVTSQAHGQNPPPPAPAKRMRVRREKHPVMRTALNNLEKAKGALERADRDFHGHRAKALDLVKQAIEEVKAGMASDPE